MASGPLVGGSGDGGSREKHRWSESKVYTRKIHHNKGSKPVTQPQEPQQEPQPSSSQPQTQTLEPPPTEDANSAQQLQQTQTQTEQAQVLTRCDADDSSSLPPPVTVAAVPEPETREPPSGNGLVTPPTNLENRVKVNLTSRSKRENRELRRKLANDLDRVQNLVKKLEGQGIQFIGYGRLQIPANDAIENNGGGLGVGVRRVNTEVVPTVGHLGSRPFNQLSVSVFENNHGGIGDLGGGGGIEKEKRTPKANQYYRNSEFLLGKDKFPPQESYKKHKSSHKKHGGGEGGYGYADRYTSQVFKSCSTLLGKLMKHKHGWVFNTPVDVKALGLHDYFTIIKHPMDLGTVKTRLNKNWYKSPREFAEDVRLTFNNAMRYNPQGQDVHIMAAQLSSIFEDKWAAIQREYNTESRFELDYEMALPTPTSKKVAPLPPPLPPVDMRRTLDRSESMTIPMDTHSNLKPSYSAPIGRTPVPKKPKAKDPNKRDMTFDEKQKLSTNLQSLPSEKLDNIVSIIKKRNAELNQHDDEIEVDIDSVDVETLWELDRFVTNYKKSLSKNKRKAELAIQAREEAQHGVQQMNPASVPPQASATVHAPMETNTANGTNTSLSPSRLQGEKRVDNASRSSSSSSSSSDSGSSSSDSDSDSSSASEAGHSPRT